MTVRPIRTPSSPIGWLLGLVGLLLAAVVAVWLWPAAPITVPAKPTVNLQDPGTIERGRYLATVGNCQACHTPRGSEPYAGGRGLATPFGTVYSSNLTPAAEGLGGWSAGDFWRALHHGQSRDGRWLYPAFPYNNTTHITRADSDALFAFLQSLPPVPQRPPAHQVGWPYNTQAALNVWRTLYFEAAPEATPQPSTAAGSTDPARGAYLVNGLAHCSACHAPRNALGANANMLDLAGGLMPVQNWYAPSLKDPAEAGVQDWPLADIVALFREGRAGTALVTGPMAEVVQHSTQHWRETDLQAMAQYLQQLPRQTAPVHTNRADAQRRINGADTYKQHCASCHGEQGEGVRLGNGSFAYPPLAGNRAVTLSSPANLVQIVNHGGFAPSTAEQPRPFGMPPFMLVLNNEEVAAVLTHMRTHWGNQAAPVSALDVQQLR